MELVWIIVTRRPTAEWIAQQITEAFPWKEAPRYLIRDQDGVHGVAVTESGHGLAFMSTRLETIPSRLAPRYGRAGPLPRAAA
jgi:hypothetical protein